MNSESPRISVIIPVFHTEVFLGRALHSVRSSSLHDIEILIIDDGSGQECRAIAEIHARTDPRIRYIRHSSNRGLLEARLTGISHAHGEYIAHLDPDDEINRLTYELAYLKAKEHKADIVMFNAMQKNEDGVQWIENHNLLGAFDHMDGHFVLGRIFGRQGTDWIWHVSWNKLIRRETARKLLRLRLSGRHLVMYEDLLCSVALFLQIGHQPKCASIPFTGIIYYRHHASATQKQSSRIFLKNFDDARYVLSSIGHLLRMFHAFDTYRNNFEELRTHILNMFHRRIPKQLWAKNPLKYLQIKSDLLHHYHQYRQLQIRLDRNRNMEVNAMVNTVVEQGLQDVYIYGSGEIGLLLRNQLDTYGIRVTAFVCTSKESRRVDGVNIISVNDAISNGARNFIIGSLGSAAVIRATLEQEAARANANISVIGCN